MKKIVPGLLHTHSVACVLVVAMLDPIKFVDSYLEKLNDNLNGIFKFHYQSAVRRQGLKRIAEIFEDFKKIRLLNNIRWIASRSRLFNLVESNYSILVYDLEQKSYNQSEIGKKALGCVTFMKQPNFLFSLHFLQDLVETIRPASLKFQQNDLLSCEIRRMIDV